MVADLATIAARWPIFHQELLRQTPYQSVVSVPLHARDGVTRLGALNLYLVVPEAVPDFFISAVSTSIAAPISTVLFDHEPGQDDPDVLPPWLNNAAVSERMRVWVAVGILIENADISNADALAALRAYAFGHDDTIDHTAARLIAQELQPQVLTSSHASA
ncbi:MAG TPA: ANTAR domain-containing protein [Propionibacteriaceae bacterium]